MLLEFGFRNFFSFKEGASISFRLDAKCPVSISQGKAYSTVMGVKGANGAGKTQVMKALQFLGEFNARSFSYPPEASMQFAPFFHSEEASDFYAEFAIDETTYFYELSCTQSEVLSETFYQRVGKKVKVLERKANEVVFTTKKLARLQTIKLRKNASLLSTAHQHEFDELAEVHRFFKNIVANVTYSGFKETLEVSEVATMLASNRDALEFVNRFVPQCDSGVERIELVELENSETSEKSFYPIFLHVHDGENFPVTQFTESNGNKFLFRFLPMYHAVLDHGGIAVVDEFDAHLHPHILPKLIELFTNENSNPKNAQLLFTTHDSEVLDVLGRYRVYLVNKNDNESFAYRLDEIPGDLLRNDRSILPTYREGKIGGVPRL